MKYTYPIRINDFFSEISGLVQQPIPKDMVTGLRRLHADLQSIVKEEVEVSQKLSNLKKQEGISEKLFSKERSSVLREKRVVIEEQLSILRNKKLTLRGLKEEKKKENLETLRRRFHEGRRTPMKTTEQINLKKIDFEIDALLSEKQKVDNEIRSLGGVDYYVDNTLSEISKLEKTLTQILQRKEEVNKNINTINEKAKKDTTYTDAFTEFTKIFENEINTIQNYTNPLLAPIGLQQIKELSTKLFRGFLSGELLLETTGVLKEVVEDCLDHVSVKYDKKRSS